MFRLDVSIAAWLALASLHGAGDQERITIVRPTMTSPSTSWSSSSSASAVRDDSHTGLVPAHLHHGATATQGRDSLNGGGPGFVNLQEASPSNDIGGLTHQERGTVTAVPTAVNAQVDDGFMAAHDETNRRGTETSAAQECNDDNPAPTVDANPLPVTWLDLLCDDEVLGKESSYHGPIRDNLAVLARHVKESLPSGVWTYLQLVVPCPLHSYGSPRISCTLDGMAIREYCHWTDEELVRAIKAAARGGGGGSDVMLRRCLAWRSTFNESTETSASWEEQCVVKAAFYFFFFIEDDLTASLRMMVFLLCYKPDAVMGRLELVAMHIGDLLRRARRPGFAMAWIRAHLRVPTQSKSYRRLLLL